MRGLRPTRWIDTEGEERPANQRAYEQLRRLILRGDLEPGAPIGEVEAAARLGMSRTPVRDAMRHLLNEGLLDEGPRSQVTVAALAARTEEILSLHAALQRCAVVAAVPRLDPPAVERLHLLLVAQARAIRRDGIHDYLDLEDELFSELPRLADLVLAEGHVRRVRGLLRLVLDSALVAESWQEMHQDVEDLVEAVEAGEVATVERCLDRYLDRVASLVVAPDSDTVASAR